MKYFRTVLPCGMNKDPNRTTLVEAGEPLKVTWHLGYPHRGGVQIELLDAEDKKLLSLTPDGEYVGEKEVRPLHVTYIGISLISCSFWYFPTGSRVHRPNTRRLGLPELLHPPGAASS